MKKYLLKRILFSLFSLFVVIGTVMVIVYSLIDRELIFVNDTTIVKKSNNELEVYKVSKYAKYGYLEYDMYTTYCSRTFKEKYGEGYQEREDYQAAIKCISDAKTISELTNPVAKTFISEYKGKGYEVVFLPKKVRAASGAIISNAYLYAKKDINVFVRLLKYFGNMFQFETINDVQDENLKSRYIRIEWDTRSNMPALVGSGTTHKYLIYFDGRFPFVHQNILHLNLGSSYTVYRDVDLVEVMGMPTGEAYWTEQEYPADIGTGITHSTSYDFHTVTYSASELSEADKEIYGENEHYINAKQQVSGLSRIGNSFVIGIISTIICYLIGLPLGILLALKKDKIADKIGNLYIIFIMAVPALAYIFMFATIGMNVFHLPYKFATASVKVLAYILPTISLALPAIGGLMKWMRRYMIDQMNSDYVKFARSQGLSEGEIFSKHISRNALIFIVHSIPADLLGALTGAIITERVYGVPGVGGLLTDAINGHDNGIIIGCTLFFTVLTILSLILGDLLLAKYDPRISFTEGGN